MDTELSFVAPEGVYTLAHRIAHSPLSPPLFPARLGAAIIPTAPPPLPTHDQPLFALAHKPSVARPRHSLKSSSSSFITRILYPDGVARAIHAASPDAPLLFYNLSKTFIAIEAAAHASAREPLCRITFSVHPTCHNVNRGTASSDHLDIVIGFSTGDLLWLDPVSARYARLNKQGCITNSPCTAVRWLPSSPSLFLVAHADGSIVAYDKERDDGVFVPSQPDHSWDPTDTTLVTMPPWHPAVSANHTDKSDKEKAAKNPVSHWRVSNRKIVDFVFSPDVKYVAAISEDGCLRVIDAMSEQLVDCYASYFGALTCVAWSPDGRFILTGGQDDLLTLFSPWEQRVVARCQGHSSFVSAVAFDELRCDGRTYRFGSVGEDNKLILWDFSSGVLHRPKTTQASHHRMSMSSSLSLAKRDRSALFLPSTQNEPSPRYHPAPSRSEIAIVQPVLVKPIESDLLSDIQFLPHSVLTATKMGEVKLWVRPLAPRSSKSRKREPEVV